jgi:hypothetical protein
VATPGEDESQGTGDNPRHLEYQPQAGALQHHVFHVTGHVNRTGNVYVSHFGQDLVDPSARADAALAYHDGAHLLRGAQAGINCDDRSHS